ncbi:alpha/beta hydrolase [bacterium]|nr:alpha/beta hydrolase [bacterium]
MPTFDLPDGARLHYEDCGQGQPLVFIHGVWMSSRFFQKQVPALSRRFRVIAVDLRGHGQSAHVMHGHTVAQYARDVRALIDGLGLRDVVLAGWSMGAFVLWDYLRQFGPHQVKATIVVEESASDFKWPDWPVGLTDFTGLCQMMQAVQEDRGPFVHEFIKLMLKDPPAAVVDAWMFAEITRLPEAIASAILFDQTVQDYRAVIPTINLPTLLCFGRDEKLIPVAAGEHLQHHLADARLVIFENSGHCPFLEEAEKFNQEIERFVTALA